jgi:hypothetical protein
LKLIEQFAKSHRLRIKADRSGDVFVPGKRGHIFEHSETRLGVYYGSEHASRTTPQWWSVFREKAVAAGMKVEQCGDAEGNLSFDPSNTEQARVALEIVAAGRKRQVSQRLLDHLKNIGFRPRRKPVATPKTGVKGDR